MPESEVLQLVNPLLDILKTKPELFLTAFLLVWGMLERSERKSLQKTNFELVDKMATQNKDTNELLGQIKFLLEVLTKGRSR